MRKSMVASWLVFSGCAAIAIGAAPPKQVTPQTARGKAVAASFWSALHEGRYDDIEPLIEAHQQVALDEPGDVITLSHLGWLHVWALGERARKAPAASVIEHIPLSRRYFEEAVALDPNEPRYLGFLASLTMAEGSVLKNEKVTRTGFFMMKDAVAAWPEFNLFTSGYSVSNTPVDQAPFQEGLAQQWQTLEVCFRLRSVPTASTFDRRLETKEGHPRACWNSWIAPHNLEGFFLNFGDMLVRAGDVKNAKGIYEAAKLSQTYEQWPYRGVLERRLASLDGLKARFASAKRGEPEHVTMFDTAFSCMACHQASGAPSVHPQP
jgi:hypothetical protein